jgi:hypothetical protein
VELLIDKNGEYYSDGSKIGYGYLPSGSTSVEILSHDFLSQTCKNQKEITEDARKFTFKDNDGYDRKYLFCNRVKADGLPHPVIYRIENGVGQLVASPETDHFLAKAACKSFMLLPKNQEDQGKNSETLAITRPWFGFHNYGERSIWLLKLNQPNDPTRWFDCEPIKVLIQPEPNQAVVGISTIAGIPKSRDRFLLFWHVVTSLERTKKQYPQYVSLFDNKGNELKRSREPFLTTQDFPECQDLWVPGALYFTNVHIGEKNVH